MHRGRRRGDSPGGKGPRLPAPNRFFPGHTPGQVAPFIKFHFDENLKKEIEVLDLLRKVAEENAELDRKRAESAEQLPQE